MVTYRSKAVEEFQIVQGRARWDMLRAKLLGKANHLLSFAAQKSLILPQRKYLGIQEIPVCQVVGSVDRNQDFDRDFRPLKGHLLGRWVKAYVSALQDNWSPIQVYKIGTQYYVQDGHHRTSVARQLGRYYIDAEVWEHPLELCEPKRPISLQALVPCPPCAAFEVGKLNPAYRRQELKC